MGKIVVIGSSNTDLVVTTPKIPVPGETILGNDFSIIGGGKGAVGGQFPGTLPIIDNQATQDMMRSTQ